MLPVAVPEPSPSGPVVGLLVGLFLLGGLCFRRKVFVLVLRDGKAVLELLDGVELQGLQSLGMVAVEFGEDCRRSRIA